MTPLLVELDEETFTDLVLNRRGTVAVAFLMSALRASRELEARLARIAVDFAGRALLARVEAFKSPSLSKLYGLDVIPALLLFHDGAEIGRLDGVRPPHHYSIAIESALHATLGGQLVRLDNGST